MATTHYVSTTGNDNNLGTSTAAPSRTLSRGADAVQPGDTLYIRGGTYVEHVTFDAPGTSSARITISSYQGEAVIIDGNNQLPPGTYGSDPDPIFGALVKISGNHVEIHDRTIRDSRGRGLQVINVTAGVLVDNVDARFNWGSATTSINRTA